MPRSRGSDLPQRQSPRGPHQLRTSTSDSDPLHHRPIADRSPKLGADRRSPRGAQPEAVSQKKLGTRIADLESQLGQAQEELKLLKDQLASAEAAKREAQKKAEQAEKRKAKNGEAKHQDADDSQQEETDVFEVPVEKLAIEVIQPPEKEISEADELKVKDEEIALLKSSVESVSSENENLKSQLSESASKASGMALLLSKLGEELEASRANAGGLGEKLKSVEAQKEGLESEMKKLRVQTEQWRKAADAAAAVLAGGVDMGPRAPERCGSMEKHFGGGGGSPGMADGELDDSYASVKRKNSGIRVFGDLWKKKSQK